MSSLIHRTDHIECFFEDRGGDTLLITFNEMGMRADGRRFWGDALARKLGISVAGFVSAEPNWFPAAAMPDAVAALETAVQGRFSERIAYGHSQGGYAAIKLGRALRATASLAFCPQYSIDPADVVDPRFNRYFRPDIHAGMRIGAEDAGGGGRTFVFYDPYEDKDALHARLISAVVPTREVRMPFSGHSTVRLFAGSEIVAELIAACRAEDAVGRLARLRAAAKSRNPNRAYLMVLALAARHPALAAAVFEAHRARMPWSQWGHACVRLATHGKTAKASLWAEEAAEAEPGNGDIRACAALASLELGRPHDALRHIDLALDLQPDSAKYAHIRKRALGLLEKVAVAA